MKIKQLTDSLGKDFNFDKDKVDLVDNLKELDEVMIKILLTW
jgi:hypothetical protein